MDNVKNYHGEQRMQSTGFLNLVSPVQFGPGVLSSLPKSTVLKQKTADASVLSVSFCIIFVSFLFKTCPLKAIGGQALNAGGSGVAIGLIKQSIGRMSAALRVCAGRLFYFIKFWAGPGGARQGTARQGSAWQSGSFFKSERNPNWSIQ